MMKQFLADLLRGQKPNSVKEVEEEFQYYAEILAEYELIKNKKSKLPRNKREIVEEKALRIIATRNRK